MEENPAYAYFFGLSGHLVVVADAYQIGNEIYIQYLDPGQSEKGLITESYEDFWSYYPYDTEFYYEGLLLPNFG